MGIFRKVLIISIGMLFLQAGNVFAQDQNILVEIFDESQNKFVPLSGNPIFDVSNFLPGESITKTIRVHNYTNEAQTIGLKVTNFDRGCVENYCLADKLFLTITQNATPLYSGSLTQFYNAGEIPLSEVGGGEYNDYNLTVNFLQETKREEYQGAKTSFDLEIGFFLKETVSEEPASGGGGYAPPIIGVVTRIIITSSPTVTSNSATITCSTDIPAFCRVIYDTESHPVLGNPPNYGYQWSTEPENSKSTSHSITLSDLEPETTYYYRLVCWASPFKITKEYNFTTLALIEEEKKPKKEIKPEEKIPPTGEIIPEAPTPSVSPPEKKKPEEGPILPTNPTPPFPTPSVILTPPISFPTKIFSKANFVAAIQDIASSIPKLALISFLLLVLAGIFGRRIYFYVKAKRGIC